MRPASPGREFFDSHTAMFGHMRSLMLHLFTANNALWSTFGLAFCMIFDWALLVILMD
jgi:hypothetical protein